MYTLLRVPMARCIAVAQITSVDGCGSTTIQNKEHGTLPHAGQ